MLIEVDLEQVIQIFSSHMAVLKKEFFKNIAASTKQRIANLCSIELREKLQETFVEIVGLIQSSK